MPSRTNASFATPISSRFLAWVRASKAPVQPKPRSLLVGYILTFVLGVYGVHRLYFMHPRWSWLYYAAAWAICLAGMTWRQASIAGFGLVLVAILLILDLSTLWIWGAAVINAESARNQADSASNGNPTQHAPGATQ